MSIKSLPFIILYLCSLLCSCTTTTSYQSAVHQNQDNKYGDLQDDALFLVEVMNYSQFIEEMSVLAQKKDKAYSKSVFDLATTLASDHKTLQWKLELLALKKQAKLPDQTNEAQKKMYKEAFDMNSSYDFDRYYLASVREANDTLIAMSTDYLENSSDEAIVKFIKNNRGILDSNKELMQDVFDKLHATTQLLKEE